MRVKFLASKKNELKRLVNLYGDYQWFIDNDFPVILPAFFKKIYKKYGNADLNKNLIDRIFDRELNRIYKKNIYTKKAFFLKNNWVNVEKNFLSVLADLKIKPSSDFFCYLSLYGPAGQFKTPNIINLRIANKKDLKEANISIAHEIIHLLLYKKFTRMRLGYKQTEGMVDLFFTETDVKKIFPKYEKQTIAIHDKNIFAKIAKIKYALQLTLPKQ